VATVLQLLRIVAAAVLLDSWWFIAPRNSFLIVIGTLPLFVGAACFVVPKPHRLPLTAAVAVLGAVLIVLSSLR